MVFKGSTSTTAESVTISSAAEIISFTISNTSGGAATASVLIYYGSTGTHILYNEAVASGETYVYLGSPITIPTNYKVYVSVSASCDFYFSIE